MKKLIVLILIFLVGCIGNYTNQHAEGKINFRKSIYNNKIKPLSIIEISFKNAGLVDIHKLDTNIKVDLKYSTKNNLFGFDAYGALEKAYLQKDVANKLINAQKKLSENMPGAKLIIFDAARPRRVQQILWDSLKMPFKEKIKYVSNPKNGSLHNFGAAVDLSILNKFGKELDMGSFFDFIGELSNTDNENKLLNKGKLSLNQIKNRKLLRKIMKDAGFFNIQSEWWHFNSCTRKEAFEKYTIIE